MQHEFVMEVFKLQSFCNEHINLVLMHCKNPDLEVIDMPTDQLAYFMVGCGERFSSRNA